MGCAGAASGKRTRAGHGGRRPSGAMHELTKEYEMKTKDPVCGMDIDSTAAFATEHHGGQTYYLCSASCRDKFHQDPARYVQAPQPAAAHAGGCGHAEHSGHGCCK